MWPRRSRSTPAQEFTLGVMAFPLDIPGTPYRRLLNRAEAAEQAIIEWANAYPVGKDTPNLMDAEFMQPQVRRGAMPAGASLRRFGPYSARVMRRRLSFLCGRSFYVSIPKLGGAHQSLTANITGGAQDANVVLELRDLDFVLRESMRLLTRFHSSAASPRATSNLRGWSSRRKRSSSWRLASRTDIRVTPGAGGFPSRAMEQDCTERSQAFDVQRRSQTLPWLLDGYGDVEDGACDDPLNEKSNSSQVSALTRAYR